MGLGTDNDDRFSAASFFMDDDYTQSAYIRPNAKGISFCLRWISLRWENLCRKNLRWIFQYWETLRRKIQRNKIYI